MAAQRAHGPRALAALLPKVAEPALRRRGFAAVEIVTSWAEIVGPALAGESAPERLSFSHGARSGGTLHVRTSGAVALEMQHLAPIVMERINTCFGYAAVARLALVQGPVRALPGAVPRRVPPPPPPDPAMLDRIESATRDIEREDLRAALRQLGKSVESARSAAK